MMQIFKNIIPRLPDEIPPIDQTPWKKLNPLRLKDGEKLILPDSQPVKKGSWNPFKSIGNTFKNIGKSLWEGIKTVFSETARSVFMNVAKTLGSTAKILTNSAKTVLNSVATTVRPFSSKAADKIDGVSNKIDTVNRYIDEGIALGETFSHSTFYAGDYLKPWEVRDKPTQTGPKGIAVDIDKEAFNNHADGDDISPLAKDLLEANAPVVRQWSNDATPMSTEDLMANAENNGDHYDLNDTFTDNKTASHVYQPKTYAYATKENDHIIKLTYERFYPNSFSPAGPSETINGPVWHEGDYGEKSIFYYDINKQEIVGARVLKHGEGETRPERYHSQQDIEFMNGRPVINVALGSHATSLASGVEKVDNGDTRTLDKIGIKIYDHYASSEDVRDGKAFEIFFSPEDVIVDKYRGKNDGGEGVETSDAVSFDDRDRYVGRIQGDRRRRAATDKLPIQKFYSV